MPLYFADSADDGMVVHSMPAGVCAVPGSVVSRTANPSCSQQELVDRMSSEAPLQESELIQQVMDILYCLSAVPANGLTSSCCSAAQVLLSHLHQEVDCVSLCSYTDGCPSVCLLSGTAGLGQRVLQEQLIMTGSRWAPTLCCMQRSPYLYRTVTAPEDTDALPQDWAALHERAGLNTFLAVKITQQQAGSDSPNVVGVLCLGSCQPSAFMDDSWGTLLSMVATGFVPLLTSPWLAGLAGLSARLVDIASVDGFAGFIAAFLQGAGNLLETTTNKQLGVRLGLLSEDAQDLLLLHPSQDAAACKILQSGEQLLVIGESLQDSRDCVFRSFDGTSSFDVALQQLSMTRLAAKRTLVTGAVRSSKPCFVSDMQACLADENAAPLDMLVPGASMLGSTVVLPLFAAHGQALGGLYLTHNEAGEFLDSSSVHEQGSMLQALLQQELVDMEVDMDEVQSCCSPVIRSLSSLSASSSLSSISGSCCSAALGSTTSRSTDLDVLQKVWRLQDQQAACVSGQKYLQELQLHSVLGVGGFSTVYAGIFHGSRTAIKVMRVAQDDALGIPAKSAMEMAALSTLRHPNIVSSYACLTDMVQERNAGARPAVCSSSIPFRKPLDIHVRQATAADLSDAGCDLFNILVMERCDRGNLWDAVCQEGLLHRRLPDGRLRVSMVLLYTVLLDVAAALKYMHSLQLVHLDVKASNVLLQTTSGRHNGFPVAKLGDLGLVKLLGDKGYITNRTTSGTLTHVAPERLQSGSLLTTAADVYSFGILMYELYTGSRPYAGVAMDKRLMKLIWQGLRPQFPANTPHAYRALAEACWAHNIRERPTFDTILHQLQECCWHACLHGKGATTPANPK